ncbi:MAG: SDR family oxidoreductase [Solirubrobacterales bacterium]
MSATEGRSPAAAPSANGSARSPAGTTVVVGAAQGIGAGIARRMAAESWTTKLVLADIKLDGVEEIAGELGGGEAEVEGMAVDIADAGAVDELVAASAEAERVVFAAGLFAPAPALEVEREEFARIFEVNTEGVFFVAQAYARAMAERGHGAIVGVASIAARMPRMRQTAYCSSKAGMRQALRVLGMEVAPLGVRVNTVSPGPTDTPMMRALAADHSSVDDLAHGSIEAMRPRIPNGRVARPEDVAAVVSFLLAPGSEHVMLEDIVVDGGELLGM